MKKMRKKISKTKTREQESYTPYYKLILIGENEVGKTELLRRFTGEKYLGIYYPTFGVDFRIKSIYDEKGNLSTDVQLIDIAGEKDEMHTKIEDDFIKNANAFLCVFDINDENSVIKAVNIKESYEDKLGEFKKNKKWYLIGNKKDKDLLDKKIPSQYKNRFNNYFEISANTSKDSEFDIILRKIIEELNLQQKENKGIIDDSEMEKENFEIDFETAHGNVFDEECEIF